MTTLNDSRLPPHNQRQFSIGTPGIPWYRDIKVLRILAQVIFILLIGGALFGLVKNLVTNLRASNLALDFEVYKRPFNVALSEGMSITTEWTWMNNVDAIAFAVVIIWLVLMLFFGRRAYQQYKGKGEVSPVPVVIMGLLFLWIIIYPPTETAQQLSDTLNKYFFPSSMSRAFVTGVTNTLRVVAASLVASTLVGILIGIGLLTKNFLLGSVARVYVEIFRNTPLLVQLFFTYRTLGLLLPAPRQSIFSPSKLGPIEIKNSFYILNARGFYIAELIPKDTVAIFYLSVVIALFIGWFIRRRRLIQQELTGIPAHTWRIILPIMLAIMFVGWILARGAFTIDYPYLDRLNIQGGTQFTTGFFSLFVGLTLYTSAFIAEIVRAGIQSVPYGQIEAARSQGLSNVQVLNLVILPQALRLIIPPLGNQYVNLGKNSSLGLAVNYLDTYRVANLANNESGQAVPFFVGLMILYLLLSLALSMMTNFINRIMKVQVR